jgi:hypothetical protein
MKGLAALVDRAAAVSAFQAELAAFVTRDENGALRLISWGTEVTPFRTTYRGIVPPNVLLIVHTHPDRRRRPSDHDMKEARRLQIPIWVLTRGGIWAANPSSDEPVMVLNDAGWTRRVSRRDLAKYAGEGSRGRQPLAPVTAAPPSPSARTP